MTQPIRRNLTMKIPTFETICRFFVTPILKSYFNYKRKYFVPKRRTKEWKPSSHFRFRLGKCAAEFKAQEFPEVFLGLRKFAKYYICISRLFLTFAL